MWTINEIREAHERAGKHFFSPDAMKQFNSYIHSEVFEGPGGVYFVTSEKPPRGLRLYKVRRFYPDTANIRTAVAGFGNARTAKSRARELARGEACS